MMMMAMTIKRMMMMMVMVVETYTISFYHLKLMHQSQKEAKMNEQFDGSKDEFKDTINDTLC